MLCQLFRSSTSGGGGANTSFASTASPAASSGRTYVDNALNRRLGRVGKPLGSMVVSRDSGIAASPPRKVYVDNAANRRLGTVRMDIGTIVVSQKKTVRAKDMERVWDHIQNDLVSGYLFIINLLLQI